MAEPLTAECPGCFQQKQGENATCPRCGYNADAPRSLSLLPVQTQLKRYVIGDKLGQGGFGITYRGFDLKLRMRVAIKEYYPSDVVGRSGDRKTLVLLSAENDALFQYGLKAFINEAHTLAQLQHPNLVRVLNLFEMNSTAYLVMDYYEGETLHDHLARQPGHKLPWRRAIRLLLPVLDGLQEVHRNGFMHRDVKPRNLYLTHREQLVLLDFGAARQVVSDRTRSLAVYTSGYAAYEQHVQGAQGPWTDVYGAAATLYCMLTAHAPPPAVDRQRRDAIKPARHFTPDLPPALDNILGRALVVDPKKRLQTITELEQQLRAVVEQEDKFQAELPGKAKPPGPDQPGKLRIWAALSGALVLVLLAAGLFRIFSDQPPKPLDAPKVVLTPVKPVEPPPPVEPATPPIATPTPIPPPVEPEPATPPIATPTPIPPPVEPEPVTLPVATPAPALPPVEPEPETLPVATPAPAPPLVEVPTPTPTPDRTYLTVKTEPPDAQIRIMNIGPAYQPGIELLPGTFDLEVSAPGYQTHRQPYEVAAGERELKITLQAAASPPSDLTVFRDKLRDGSDGPAMVVIPAGEFMMGSPKSETGRYGNERQHSVKIERAFAIGRYEVTFAEYDQFCAAENWKKPSDEGWGRGTQPVVNVSWEDATAYAEWLSAQTGQNYRLPTEAEWEYAARAGTTTVYWWGKEEGRNRANCSGCSSEWDERRMHPVPVRSFKPNPWGLYNMAGNVWEWTCSLYNEQYSGAETKCIDKKVGGPRSLRGGSWYTQPAWVRSAGRSWYDPTARNYAVGFRLARSL